MIPPDILRRIPGVALPGAQPHIQILPGGQGRNQVLRIDTPEGRYVWRRRLPPLDRPGSLAKSELLAHRAADAAGLAPHVLDAAADGSWILMEYVEAPAWAEARLCCAEGIERIGARLALLQALEVPTGIPPVDAQTMARGYLAKLGARDAAAAAALQPLVTEVDRLTCELDAARPPSCIAHGDLMAANMLGPLPLLVDWEYAQATDASWDCACLLAYYPAAHPFLDRLLGSAGLDGAPERERLHLQRRRFVLLNRLWEQAYPL